jgi:hypothetical protein
MVHTLQIYQLKELKIWTGKVLKAYRLMQISRTLHCRSCCLLSVHLVTFNALATLCTMVMQWRWHGSLNGLWCWCSIFWYREILNLGWKGVQNFAAIIFWTPGSIYYRGFNILQQYFEPGFKISRGSKYYDTWISYFMIVPILTRPVFLCTNFLPHDLWVWLSFDKLL